MTRQIRRCHDIHDAARAHVRPPRAFVELDPDDLEGVGGGMNRITRLYPNGGGRVSVLPAPGGGPFDMDGQQVVPGNSPFAARTTMQLFDDGSTAQIDQRGSILQSTEALPPHIASFQTTIPGLASTDQAQAFAEQNAQEILRANQNLDSVNVAVEHTGLRPDGTPTTNMLSGVVNSERFNLGEDLDGGVWPGLDQPGVNAELGVGAWAGLDQPGVMADMGGGGVDQLSAGSFDAAGFSDMGGEG